MPGLPVAASFEPVAALDGGPDGLAIIRRLLPQLPAVVAPDGTVLLEIGADQAEAADRGGRGGAAGLELHASTRTSSAAPGWPSWTVPMADGSPAGAAAPATPRPWPTPSWPLPSGGIVGLPTETVYGIGVLPRPEALDALIAAKQRPQDKGIPLLIDGLDQVDGLLLLSDRAQRAGAIASGPAPLTLVLPSRRPGAAARGRSPAAVTRSPCASPTTSCPGRWRGELGPIAVTSANRSGEVPRLAPQPS